MQEPATLAVAVEPSAENLEYRTPAFELGAYALTCIPARNGEGQVENWTLKQLGDDAFHARLRAALPREACTYYAPTVNAMSGAVLSHKAFDIEYHLDGSRSIRRPGYDQKDARIPCDGTFIVFGEGGIMAAGGCPILVLNGVGSDTDICLFAHGGRDSLIDKHLVCKGRPSRAHFSVVGALVAYAQKHFGANPSRLILRSFFALPWEAFPHDPNDREYGERNRKLERVLLQRGLTGALKKNKERLQCLDLGELIRLQAERLSVGHVDAHLLPLPKDGDFAYTRHALPELAGTMRNLVVLQRSAL